LLNNLLLYLLLLLLLLLLLPLLLYLDLRIFIKLIPQRRIQIPNYFSERTIVVRTTGYKRPGIYSIVYYTKILRDWVSMGQFHHKYVCENYREMENIP